VRLDADPRQALSPERFAAGIRRVEAQGLAVLRRPGDRELTLTFDSASRDAARAQAVLACEQAFGTTPSTGVVTFVSRGTDEDALGVVEAFGLRARLERVEEVAVFTLPAADRRRVPEGRLHTALEAALNCEIRIQYA
jgi:hypothetical protein